MGKLKLLFDILNDPRVEWRVTEQIGWDPFHWEVAVGERRQSGQRMHQDSAMDDLRRAARVLLGEGLNEGHTRPCVICDQPSRVGQTTCSDQCQGYLDKARSELAAPVL